MAYLNTTARTVSTPSNEKFQPLGRSSMLTGVFIGWVKRTDDIQKMGRLQVWVPEFGSQPEDPDGWITVSYCSPFAGSTNVDTASKSDFSQFEGTETSYGMWMVPPDINNQVVVMFVSGDASRGIWIGNMFNQFMNNMVPGMTTSANNYQFPGKKIPVADYNKWDTSVTQPDRLIKPYQKTKFKGIGNQGLITDVRRGVTDSSSRRESPSQVFGIVTPGPVIVKDTEPNKIRRKGGSSIIMDDAEDSEYVQLSTKSGAQININETNGFVYLVNRDGTSWVQMDKDGNIDIFGANNISMRAQRDVNIRADRNINIEAGQNIFMKAAKDTIEKTTEFTYNVNNIPKPSTIPVWSYVGEGNGTGGNIVLQALNNLHGTIQKDAYLTIIENNLDIQIGTTLDVTTLNGGQNFRSKQGIKLATEASVDIAATGNIREHANGSISVSSGGNLVHCTDSSYSLNVSGNIIETAGGEFSLDAASLHIGTNILVDGNIDLKVLKSTEVHTPVIYVPNVQTSVIYASTIYASVNNPSPGAPPRPPVPPVILNPIPAEDALIAAQARPAEIKPMNDKLNVLATWKDPTSKFVRDTQSLQTTVSRFPTYEPCPEHDSFLASSVSTTMPVITSDDKTYAGSAGKGNNATVPPPPAVNPGATNTQVKPDPVADSATSKDLNTAALRCQLTIHEGLKDKSYLDSLGLPTGGIGHLLRSNEIPSYPVGTPISPAQIETWYNQDSSSAIKTAQDLAGSAWANLSDNRKRAMADLAYNLGQPKMSKFKNFLSSMKAGDYTKAGADLKQSVWYTQVGRRGPNIIAMIVNDVDPNGCDKKFPG